LINLIIVYVVVGEVSKNVQATKKKVAGFKFEKNLIMFTWKGFQFFVEYSGKVNSFSDIIVRSS
jgi:hypothetical protein